MENTSGWKLEVANYAHTLPSTWSHAKFLIIDQEIVSAVGFNVDSAFLVDLFDLGAIVRGPIAENAVLAFDELWDGSEGQDCNLLVPATPDNCTEVTVSDTHVPLVQTGFTSNNAANVFSLLSRTLLPANRDADRAVRPALAAATSSIDVAQQRTAMHPFGFPYCWLDRDIDAERFDDLAPPYLKGIVDAILANSSNPAFRVRILNQPTFLDSGDTFSPGDFAPPVNIDVNACTIRFLQAKLGPNFDTIEFRDTDRMHAKVSAIDEELLMIGSQNWDFSSFADPIPFDLAEYILAIDSPTAAQEFLNDHFVGGASLWGSARPRVLVLEGGDLKAAIEGATNGQTLVLLGDSYELTETIEISSEIWIVGTGTDLIPGTLAAATESSARLARLQSSELFEGPYLEINADNVVISGLQLRGNESEAISVGVSGDVFETVITRNVFLPTEGDGIRLFDGARSFRIESNDFVGGFSGVSMSTSSPRELGFIRNNIFAGQEFPVSVFPEDGGSVEYAHNIFFECGEAACSQAWIDGDLGPGSTVHDNIFDVDPLFTAQERDLYFLAPSSPAIDETSGDLVSLQLQDGDGDGVPRADIGAFEYVNSGAPSADAGGPYNIDEGSALVLDGSGSTDPEEGALFYRWDVDGDSLWDTPFLDNPMHQTTFADDFSGEAKLQVEDAFLFSSTDTTPIIVQNVEPTVDAGEDQETGVGEAAQFLGSFSDPGVEDQHAIEWDFGDGTTLGDTLTPTHSYSDPGTYVVTLTVSDDDSGVGFDTAEVTVAEPETALQNFVLFGIEGVYVKKSATVVSGDIGANRASPGPYLAGDEEVTIGIGATIQGTGSRVMGDSVKLKNNAEVFDVYYNELSGLGEVIGEEVTPLELPLVGSLPQVPSFAPGEDDVVVSASESIVLGPGSYGVLEAHEGAIITFSGGEYGFSEWNVGLNVDLKFDGPSEVRIQGKLAVDQGSTLGPSAGSSLDARDIVIFVTGINGTTGDLSATPRAAKFGIGTMIDANVYVPNGTLWLRQNGQFTGGFIAKWVILGIGTTAEHQSSWE